MADRDQCLVTVCRGCCCGDVGRHPDVDHAAQVNALINGLRGRAEVRVSTCLLVCAESNVVVVSPAPSARVEQRARPVWLGGVLQPSVIDAIVQWIHRGGPGRAEIPTVLAARVAEPFGALIP